MSSQVETDARREQIAIIIADPYQKLPLAKDLAAQYACSVRTIYNDIESPDVQSRVQNLIRLHAKSTGIAAAYRVILDCIAGGKGWTKGQQLQSAQWLIEKAALFIEASGNELFPDPVGGLSKVPHGDEGDAEASTE